MNRMAVISENFRIKRAMREENRKNRLTWKQDFKKHGPLYLMMAPYFFLYMLFFIVPILLAVWRSLTDYNIFQSPGFVGLKNYIAILAEDDIFYIALKNTLVFAVITGPVSYLLCFFVAWLINEMGNKLRVFLTCVFYAPTLASSVFFVWQFIFSGDSYGLINSFLMKLGLLEEPIQWLADVRFSLMVLIIAQIWTSLGTSFLAFIAGFKSVDPALYEAADIDGVRNRYQELIYITLPIMKPQLFFSAIMQIAASFSVSTISQTLLGFPSVKYAGHTRVLHIQDYGMIKFEMGYAWRLIEGKEGRPW